MTGKGSSSSRALAPIRVSTDEVCVADDASPSRCHSNTALAVESSNATPGRSSTRASSETVPRKFGPARSISPSKVKGSRSVLARTRNALSTLAGFRLSAPATRSAGASRGSRKSDIPVTDSSGLAWRRPASDATHEPPCSAAWTPKLTSSVSKSRAVTTVAPVAESGPVPTLTRAPRPSTSISSLNLAVRSPSVTPYVGRLSWARSVSNAISSSMVTR